MDGTRETTTHLRSAIALAGAAHEECKQLEAAGGHKSLQSEGGIDIPGVAYKPELWKGKRANGELAVTTKLSSPDPPMVITKTLAVFNYELQYRGGAPGWGGGVRTIVRLLVPTWGPKSLAVLLPIIKNNAKLSYACSLKLKISSQQPCLAHMPSCQNVWNKDSIYVEPQLWFSHAILCYSGY